MSEKSRDADDLDFIIQVSTPIGGTLFWEPPQDVKNYVREIKNSRIPEETQRKMINAVRNMLATYLEIFSVNLSTAFMRPWLTERLLIKINIALENMTRTIHALLQKFD